MTGLAVFPYLNTEMMCASWSCHLVLFGFVWLVWSVLPGPVCYALVLYVLCLYVRSSGLLSTVLVYSSLGKSVTWFSVDDQTAPLTSEWTQNPHPQRTQNTNLH